VALRACRLVLGYLLPSQSVRPVVAALAAAAVVDSLRREDRREHACGEKGADEGSNGGNNEHDDISF
jgi:hypothetical protein